MERFRSSSVLLAVMSVCEMVIICSQNVNDVRRRM